MRAKVLLCCLIVLIAGISTHSMGTDLVSNVGDCHGASESVFTIPNNGQEAVDGWYTNRDGDAIFSVSKKELSSGKCYVAIAVAEKRTSHVIDFYQPLVGRGSNSGKHLTFSVRVRASRPGICQAIINDDSGTASSKFNKSTDWETLIVKKTVTSAGLTYLNAAIRIKVDDAVRVDIEDSRVEQLKAGYSFNSLIRDPIHAIGSKYIPGFEGINSSTGFAFDILLCMAILGIWLHIAAPVNPISYQLHLSTLGLFLTMYLWSNSWSDYIIVYSSWFLLVFVLMRLFSKWVRVVILSCVYVASAYYFRGYYGSPWDTLLYVGTLQLQYMRGIDIATTDDEQKKPFKNKILNFISYIGVPVNVNSFFYVRYRDWVAHADSFRSVPHFKDNYVQLLKRVAYVMLSLVVIVVFQHQISLLIFKYISKGELMQRFVSVVFSLLTFWPLKNNLLFLGSNLIGTPGIEISKMPVLTSSPIDFWRRQQLGVATFFREQVYENTWGGTERSRYRNLFYTFTFVGLWHGLTFQWAVWGLLWGVVMVTNRYYRQNYRGAVVRLFECIRLPYVYSVTCWIMTMLMLVFFSMITEMHPLLGFNHITK